MLYGAGYFAVTQFGFGLPFKLRFGYFDGNDGGEPLAEVLAGDFRLVLLQLFQFLGVFVFSVFLQRTGQCRAETGQVRTAFYGIDVVDIRMDVFRITVVVHDGYFDRNPLLFRVQVYHVVEQVDTAGINVAHEFFQTVLAMECLAARHTVLVLLAHVGQGNCDTGIQECQFAHTVSQNLIFVSRSNEDAAVRPELLACAPKFGFAYDLDRIERLTAFVFLLVDLAFPEDLRKHVGRKGVYARHTDTMKTSGHLIGALVELAACMKYGHDDFQCGLVLFFMHVYRNTAAVVLYGDGVVFIDSDFYVRTIAGKCFVDGVIHGFINQVVQTFLADVSDIHRRTFAYGFQSFQHLNAAGRIICAFYFFF